MKSKLFKAKKLAKESMIQPFKLSIEKVAEKKGRGEGH